MVQMTLERLAKNRNQTLRSPIASPRWESVDRIAVLDHGRVVAIGSHAQLIREKGLYARLAALQFGIEDGAQAAVL